ncbi:serine/threonine-protein kinase [Pseudomonas sp. D47]|uniref:serine/threonine-protein kinase n=1 Tax=Pseudomonas sp. D47 TaxID=3159447 RepID=UPI00387ACDE6
MNAVSPINNELPTLLNGRYQLEQLLGVGGMSTVYRARDLVRDGFTDPEPFVAIKILSEEISEYADANALLYCEYALTLRLHHPHVIRLHSFEIDSQSQRGFITMELMRGIPLDRLLCERPQGLPWEELREIAIAALEALSYSHSQGVLHGDIKPSNLMLTDTGVRLYDFGLGQPLEGMLSGLPRLQRSRFTAWTPLYAAPELLAGDAASTSTDVYAICCVLFELSSGRHPFPKQSDQKVNAHTGLRPSNLPKTLADALRRGVRTDPSSRISLPELLGVVRKTSQPLQRRQWMAALRWLSRSSTV